MKKRDLTDFKVTYKNTFNEVVIPELSNEISKSKLNTELVAITG